MAKSTGSVGLPPRLSAGGQPPDGNPVKRRLAAILAADVAGYSRLMGVDEVGTHRLLMAYRRGLIDPTIGARRGRIVKTTGDGLLAEFASAVDAVACAITIQRGVASRNDPLPDEKRLQFRIGINLGDVIVEADDIFGDGVNVAARLESLCEPGGLCISRAVRDQVRDKLAVGFDDFGEQMVKNIARPVRAFGLTPQTIAAAPEFGPSVARAPTIRRRHWIAAVLAVVITAAGASAWWLVGRPLMVLPPNDAMVPAPAPASIAVLPFVSLGADGGSDYFADGLTEDIISALGRFRDLSVMSRGAVFAYKGKNSTPSEVGRDLKVRYIVDGSIRRAPERIRVSVGLTDTNRGTVLWSEKYEVEPKDVFAVEDQITRRISGALAVRVTSLELARAVVIPPSNLEAYDLVLRGRDLLNRLTRSGNAVARGVFERAIGLDPNYSPAYVGLGWVNLNSVTQGWTQHPVEALEQSGNLARKAIELDDLNATGHALLGNVALHFGEHERALEELKRAIDLNSSDAESYSSLLSVLLYAGDVSGAIATGELVAQFQPDLPAHTAFHLGIAYLLSDRGADAIRVLEHSVDRNPGNLYSNLILATAYAAVGRQREAEQLTQRIRERFPTFSHEQVGAALRDPELRAKLDRALEKAGL